MMGDVTLCDGKDCSLKDKCLRYENVSISVNRWYTTSKACLESKVYFMFIEKDKEPRETKLRYAYCKLNDRLNK